jgi:phosphopantetheine adenylyltransferase
LNSAAEVTTRWCSITSKKSEITELRRLKMSMFRKWKVSSFGSLLVVESEKDELKIIVKQLRSLIKEQELELDLEKGKNYQINDR